MSDVVTLALPLFGLIALGFLVGRGSRMPAEGIRALDFFVTYCAMPALFFSYVAATPVSELSDWSFLATVTFGTYCAFAVAFSLGALLNRGSITIATVQGLVGSAGNIGYLAPALTVTVLGPAAAAPTALIFCFDTIMLQALAPLMMAAAGVESDGWRDLTRTILQRIAFHPFIIAVALGLAFSASGLAMPGAFATLVELLSGAAAPAALFALGLAAAFRQIRRPPPELPALLIIKLVAHPLIVYLLLSWVGDFPAVWHLTATLMAAMPPAAGVYVLARHYGVYVERASTAVLVGTAASVVTVSGLLLLIWSGRLPADLFL